MDLINVIPAQASVIGAMLIDERCIGPVLGMVEPADFISSRYRQVFTAIRKQFSAGEPVDLVSLVGELSADPTVEWPNLLRECMDCTPTAANVTDYVKIMREQARLTQMRDLGALLTDANTVEVAQDYISRLNALMVERPGVRIVGMEQALTEFMSGQTVKEPYVPWGFGELDRRLYVKRGKFVLIGGYPSHGKTALALQFAWTMSKDLRVGFFSLETDDGTLMERIVANVANVSMSKIKRRELDEEDYATIASASDHISQRKLEIIMASGMTVADIMATSQRRRYDIVYIDYVQLIRGDSRKNRYEQVTEVSTALHTMCQTTGITIVGLAQLSRPDVTPSGKQRAPRMSDLRESGQLEQDADVVMMLYKQYPDDPHSQRILAIEKNKEGITGKVTLNFDGDTQTFARTSGRTPPPASAQKHQDPEYTQLGFAELPNDEQVPF